MNLAQPEKAIDLRQLLSQLCQQGLISQDDADRVIALPRGKGDLDKHPLVYIADQQLVNLQDTAKQLTAEFLCEWMAAEAKLPLFNIDPLKIDAAKITSVMSYAFAEQHNILAVEVWPNRVVVACEQPFKSLWIENLEHVLNKPVERVFANPADIKRYRTEFYALSKSISGATANKGYSTGHNLEAFLELNEIKDPDAGDQHIVTIVDWIFQYAFDQRASDIHIEPRREVGYIRFRIDGVLHRVYDMPINAALASISRIKTMGRMNIAEKRKPQDGRLKTKTPLGNEVELRLSTIPTAFGEKLVMRIFDPDVLLRSFSQLGLANQDFDRWQHMTTKPNGIVLVTGPTGSGKTTTLYSTLKGLATEQVNVCSIEDPIEMIEDSFNQMQVHHAIDLDFAAGVRSLLRQDPDIIMIGEIRDAETAQMAVQAALTGHLVLSTLHTNDAPTAITRLMEVGLEPYLVRATLLGVMAQRLVRTLCPHCKAPGDIDEQQWHDLVAPWKVDPPKTVYQPVGCLECRNTGYLGRMGIYEILEASPKVQAFIQPQCDLGGMRRQAMKEGMRTLRLSGAQKVKAGMTTIEEILRVAPAIHAV
ncbi:Type II secretion system protein E [BD1-7 clade bacterium]|uniref:Type II secretion system protein E n=1 Tax=BD1-7 clade bacterium TaxID=2029982 RepID=A0A5S9Q3P0_9GAMM|nr:Type II secretion system protein E [BD1-7 clade bacterium]